MCHSRVQGELRTGNHALAELARGLLVGMHATKVRAGPRGDGQDCSCQDEKLAGEGAHAGAQMKEREFKGRLGRGPGSGVEGTLGGRTEERTEGKSA